nr:hypothetical protein [Tanacetum cinerariifolium]
MPEDIKVSLILERAFLSIAHAKIDVFKRNITFRVGDEKIIFKSVKPASSLIKRVYMLSLRERMELKLEARLMRETLILNRSLDPLYGDYIKLNDLNEPLELRRDQVNGLILFLFESTIMKLFKTLSLDESRSPLFDLLSDLEESSKEEVADIMSKTMEQYMSKTRAVYGSRVARPKVDDNDHFELKGQFLKELQDNTFSISDHKDANEHIENEDLKIKFLSKYWPLAWIAKKTEEINNFQQEPDETLYQAWERFKEFLMNCRQHYLTKVAIQDMAEYSHKWHNGTSKARNRIVKYLKGIAKNVVVGIGKFVFPIDFIILDMPEDIKVSLIIRKALLSTTHAKINVFKRKIIFRVGDEKIIFKSVKHASSLIKMGYMLSLRERIEIKLEARLMGETLILNRSLDPLYGDYIELNDLNEPLELRRDQVDDLMPAIKEFVEDMDSYLDEGMGEVVVGKPFCKVSYVETKRFDGIITIHDEYKSVTSQMLWSHTRLKHHSNEQCNKIPPLLKDLAVKKLKMLVKYLQYGILAH